MTTSNPKKRMRIPAVLVLGALATAHLCFWLFPAIFQTWDLQALDRLYVLRESLKHFRPPYDPRVAHVDLNNSGLKRLKNPYLNRRQFAHLIRNLSAMHVSAQVFDFIFVAPLNPAEDSALIQATSAAANVYYGLALELRRPGRHSHKQTLHQSQNVFPASALWQVTVQGDMESMLTGVNSLATFPELAFASRGLGSLSVSFDRDGVLRRVPLLVRCGNAFCPILPFRAVCDYLGVPPENIVLKPGQYIVLQNARKPGEKVSHNIRIPIDEQGNMIINYIGPWSSMDHYGFADALLASDDSDALQMWAEELQGKILVVADVSAAATDTGPVPTDSYYPLSGVHATIINSILTQSFLKGLPGWASLLIDMLLAVMLLVSTRLSSLSFSICTVLLGSLYLLAVGMAFLMGHLLLPVVRPLLMITLAMVAILVYSYINEERQKLDSLRQRDFVRNTFGRYLSNEVVEELLDSPQGLKMSGEMREVTLLVSDLRGFTSISNTLSPPQVIRIMNRYFKSMIEVITRYHGTVSQFMGDGILVFFGAPLRSSDDPQRAVACATEMQNQMTKVNEEQHRHMLPELAMGIGINTGKVVVGNIGSERRTTYTAIGSPINMVYRIESYTVGGQILISPSTYSKVQPLVLVRNVRQVRFKGVAHSTTLYDVSGISGSYTVHLPHTKTASLCSLAIPLPFTCFLLEDKTVGSAPVSGHIVRLGNKLADAVLEQVVQPYANILVRFAAHSPKEYFEAYAKVMPVKRSRSISTPACTRLQFTWLPAATEAILAEKLSGK